MCSRDCCGGPGSSQKSGNTCTDKKAKGLSESEKVIPTPQSLLLVCLGMSLIYSVYNSETKFHFGLAVGIYFIRKMCSNDCCSNPKGKAGDKTDALLPKKIIPVLRTPESQL
ncbi:Hypothetical predicted protein [Drosophila guanche]|uniref:Uncharacterized protein n=1 Tax=Drosophila guanche TaxID=7266 RepID=A0A3B0KJ97_DROGU|nr:Hypothetical predicted protein [Drosophila guanche]